eukprot:328607-Pyramimonas_sp.AAC.1
MLWSRLWGCGCASTGWLRTFVFRKPRAIEENVAPARVLVEDGPTRLAWAHRLLELHVPPNGDGNIVGPVGLQGPKPPGVTYPLDGVAQASVPDRGTHIRVPVPL